MVGLTFATLLRAPPVAEERLTELGIRTLGELARQDPEEMRRSFGVAGPRMVERAAGRERSVVRAETPGA